MKKLIILRHAHRDVIDSADDNGLSEKGRIQAQAIRDYFSSHYKNEKPEFFSSPKVRCQETLEPVSELYGIPFQISHLLDESSQTKYGRVEKRMREFENQWREELGPFVVICSHGDWIPEFLYSLLNESHSLKKAGLAEIHLINDKPHLENIIQSWK